MDSNYLFLSDSELLEGLDNFKQDQAETDALVAEPTASEILEQDVVPNDDTFEESCEVGESSEVNDDFEETAKDEPVPPDETTDGPFNCPVDNCGKSFPMRYMLNRHMKAHANVKSHKCANCGQSFIWKHVLKRHVIAHKDPSIIFPCEKCNKVFVYAEDLKHHKFTKHYGDEN